MSECNVVMLKEYKGVSALEEDIETLMNKEYKDNWEWTFFEVGGIGWEALLQDVALKRKLLILNGKFEGRLFKKMYELQIQFRVLYQKSFSYRII